MREDLVGEEADGNPGVGQTSVDQEAEATSGNQEAGVDEGEQEAGEEGAGERLIIVKSVCFAPDLATGSGGRS